MKQLGMFGQVVVGLWVGTFLSLAALVGASYGADAAYNFTTMDIPLHFTFLGQERDDIVRLTAVNNKGQLVGNDFASDGFFVTKTEKTTEIHCSWHAADTFDNERTSVSAVNTRQQVTGS